MDNDGNPKLLTLQQSDACAIYLGYASEDFSINDDDNNTLAKVRNSGIYLHESTGKIGSIQYVDMAT